MSIDLLREAVMTGDVGRVREVLESTAVDVNADLTPGKLGFLSNFTPTLFKAAWSINRDSLAYRALHWAARGGHVEVIDYLISVGANPDIENIIGNTPLHVAIYYGKKEAVAALIRGGADVNKMNSGCVGIGYEYLRPIHYAALYGDVHLMGTLLGAGAEISAKGQFDLTPLHLIARSSGLTAMDRLAKINFLLEREHSVDLQDKHGKTALYYALLDSDADVEFISRLLAAGADPYLEDSQGRPAISGLAGYRGDDAGNQMEKTMLFVSKYLDQDLSKFVEAFVEACVEAGETALLVNLFFSLSNHVKLSEVVQPVLVQDAPVLARAVAGIPAPPPLPIPAPPPPPPPPIKLAPVAKGLLVKKKEGADAQKVQRVADPSEDLMAALRKRMAVRRVAVDGPASEAKKEPDEFNEDRKVFKV